MITRRSFNVGLAASSGLMLLDRTTAQIPGSVALEPWSPGELDIHHIDTGRGNATFLLCPDGTTILIDCGTSNDGPDVSAPCRPDASRRPGEWVARYALRYARAAGRNTLDYLIATHIHPDHVGDIPPGAVAAVGEDFVLTGVSQVDRFMPAKYVIDRSYPHYGELPPPDAPFAKNYLAWLNARARSGRTVSSLDIGSGDQIVLASSHAYPPFRIRGVSANGRVWSGEGSEVRSVFPDFKKLPKDDMPGENSFSLSLKLTYGQFSYYTGGDLTAETRDGRTPWMDVETPVARAVGEVEVAVANHHGYFDACGPDFVKNLNAQAYIIPAWHLTHPGQAQTERLVKAWPGSKVTDVFSTEMLPANRLFNARWTHQMRSALGHVVVRVAPSGSEYRIFVVDSRQENGPVLKAFGPYKCRS